MAIPRVEWECPECGRRFAIRADMPKPDACPQCRPTPVAVETGASSGGGTADARSSVDATPQESGDARNFGPSAFEPTVIAGSRPAILNTAPRYRALRLLSIILTVLAALTFIGAVAALTLMLLAAFRIQNADLRTATILTHLAAFGGSLLTTVLLWALAELIHLLIDIEANTRRR
jgi:hypothetical protein